MDTGEILDLVGVVNCDGTRCPHKNIVVMPVVISGGDELVVLIGEAPYKEEVREGRPFVGRAGKVLAKYLDLEKYTYIIMNCINCLTYVNDVPTKPSEMSNEEVELRIANCGEYFDRLLFKIPDGTNIVLLGKYASRRFFNVYKRSDENYTEIERFGKKFKVFVVYHPAYILYRPGAIEIFKVNYSATGVFKT